ncbi:hypothetical protein [Agromyces archimandritae]|uniref:Helix-turn-helix domain-containing protein n=1 Tax=Agromyces archimandritae TaxID=2781962 RepID=A0A975FKC4_9MICO|nr:hypothetical protein [Agromyces archimandritae]QTX04125.1 hypothetical protein G127AT_12600 [Agromyces archimandritae]
MSTANGGELVRDRLWFDDGFATIPNAWLRDEKITHQARGLLVQIASHQAGFRISIMSLVAGALNGRDAIQGMLLELQRAGYLVRETYRSQGLKRYRYRLRDPHSPVDNSGQASFELSTGENKNPRSRQYPGFQDTGNPYTGFPFTENPDAKEDQVKNTHPGFVSDVTTEQPVDNSPASANDQSDAEAQSAPPAGGFAALAAARLASFDARCPGRRLGDHTYEQSGYCRDCGHRRPDEGDDALVVNTTTGEVA